MTWKLFTDCIVLWWDMFFYSEWMYFALFLPLVMILYQLVKPPFRRYILLAASWFLFFTLSGWLILYNLAVVICCREFGTRIEKAESAGIRKLLLAFGVMIPVLILFILKYADFFGKAFGILGEETLLHLAVPVGISYYTLEGVSYLTDVYREEQKAERSYVNMALFISFFPCLIEGPIMKYSDIRDDLFAGHRITYENIVYGYQRIWWGLFQKLIIADHLAPAVKELFDHEDRDGTFALAGAIFFTIQEYADFSGTIDIVIGSAKVFGITLPENFRQPFFAKNASDFWRRWHMTLGRFLRNYVFYPVSLSKAVGRISSGVRKRFGRRAAKHFTAAMALFCVWIINGLWHGPKWNYVFYGMYYFVIIFIETLSEESVRTFFAKHRLNDDMLPVRVFRFIKLSVIVVFGELFFRAEDLDTGFKMVRHMFTNFHMSYFVRKLGELGMDVCDYLTVIAGVAVLFAVSVLRENQISIRGLLNRIPAPVRYVLWYAAIVFVVVFGAYGAGYDSGDQIYAMF